MDASRVSRLKLQPRHIVALGGCIGISDLLRANPVGIAANAHVEEGDLSLEVVLAKHHGIGGRVNQTAEDRRDKVDHAGKEVRERTGERVKQLRAAVSDARAIVEGRHSAHSNRSGFCVGGAAGVVLSAATDGHILQLETRSRAGKRRVGALKRKLDVVQRAVVHVDGTKNLGDLHEFFSQVKVAHAHLQNIRDLRLADGGCLDSKNGEEKQDEDVEEHGEDWDRE